MGNTEVRAIDEGRRPPENRGTASAGRICGIIGLVLGALGLISLALGIFALPFAAMSG